MLTPLWDVDEWRGAGDWASLARLMRPISLRILRLRESRGEVTSGVQLKGDTLQGHFSFAIDGSMTGMGSKGLQCSGNAIFDFVEMPQEPMGIQGARLYVTITLTQDFPCNLVVSDSHGYRYVTPGDQPSFSYSFDETVPTGLYVSLGQEGYAIDTSRTWHASGSSSGKSGSRSLTSISTMRGGRRKAVCISTTRSPMSRFLSQRLSHSTGHRTTPSVSTIHSSPARSHHHRNGCGNLLRGLHGTARHSTRGDHVPVSSC